MTHSTRLSDILANGNRSQLAQAWGTTKAAEDFGPLPGGDYVAHVISGELFTSRQNATPGYKIAFKIIEGEHTGRQFWHDVWLTPAALPMTKRDLGKLGIASIEQLEQPVPQGIRCKVKLTARKEDDGTVYNRVRSFDVIGIDTPEADAFAPEDTPADPQADTTEGAGPLPATPDDGVPI